MINHFFTVRAVSFAIAGFIAIGAQGSDANAQAQFCTPGSDETVRLLSAEPWSPPFSTRREWLDALSENRSPAAAAAFEPLFSEEEYQHFTQGSSIIAERIRYSNDGLAITGFVVRPAASGRYPVILYNHGGVMQWGRIILPEMLEFHRLAERGYVVMASYYRGEGGSEGTPDMGGGDASDTLALLQLAGASDYADCNRIGMIGFSRGGGVLYEVLTRTDEIDAAIAIGGPTDHLDWPRRAEFDEHVYPHALAEYRDDADGTLRSISAQYFADRLSSHTNILMVHGAADERVPVEQSLAMAGLLQQNGLTYRLKIYEGGSHALTENYDDLRGEIDRWLDLYVRGNEDSPEINALSAPPSPDN